MLVTNFNSIKVRLEHSKVATLRPIAYEFQFHKGTIRTFGYMYLDDEFYNFNSIKVRLELTPAPLGRRVRFSISIP